MTSKFFTIQTESKCQSVLFDSVTAVDVLYEGEIVNSDLVSSHVMKEIFLFTCLLMGGSFQNRIAK